MGKNPESDNDDNNPYDWKTYMTALELIRKLMELDDFNLTVKGQEGQIVVFNPEGEDVVIWTGI